jgi:hypothetical protein
VDEKEAEAAREAALRIPGMLKPSQLEDKDEDVWTSEGTTYYIS